MKYISVTRRMSRDNHVDVCRSSNKDLSKLVAGMEFIEAEASLRDPKDILYLQRKFAFSNYLLMTNDEEMEVTAV